MDKKLVGFVSAISAIAPLGVAQAMPASPQTSLKADSFAELLTPIPNASEQLKISNALLAEQDAQAKVEAAQYFYHHHHHHFFHRPFFRHHHHHFFRRGFHHHHHHFYRY